MNNTAAPLQLTSSAWTEVMSDGGTIIFQGATHPFLLLLSESAAPALEYPGAFVLHPHQTAELYVLKLPAGQRLFLRALDATTHLKVAS